MSNQCNPTITCCQVDKKEANEIKSRVENCGSCCLIHEQFTLTEKINITDVTKIYRANLFAPPLFFGTVTVSNCGCTPFTVVFRTASGTQGVVVPPGGQFALTGFIEEIDIQPTGTIPSPRPIPICALFSFDLFMIVPSCSGRTDDAADAGTDVDININGNGAIAANVASVNQSINGSGSNTSTITQTATATSI